MNFIQKISIYGFIILSTAQSTNAADNSHKFQAISVSCINPIELSSIYIEPSSISTAIDDNSINREIQLLTERDAQLTAQKAARAIAIANAQRNRILAGTPSGMKRIIAKNHDGSPVSWEQLTIQYPSENDPYEINKMLEEKSDQFTRDAETYSIEIKARQRTISKAYDESYKKRYFN